MVWPHRVQSAQIAALTLAALRTYYIGSDNEVMIAGDESIVIQAMAAQ